MYDKNEYIAITPNEMSPGTLSVESTMPRYIDAKDARTILEKLIMSAGSVFDQQLAYDSLDSVPAADVEEVRHGKWIPLKQKKHWADTETVSTGIVGFYCSECGAEEKFKYKYCHCGAKMDGKEKNNVCGTSVYRFSENS